MNSSDFQDLLKNWSHASLDGPTVENIVGRAPAYGGASVAYSALSTWQQGKETPIDIAVSVAVGTERILLTPQHALNLLAWLEQERTHLEQLATVQGGDAQ